MTPDVLAHFSLGIFALAIAFICALEVFRYISIERATWFVSLAVFAAGIYYLWILSGYDLRIFFSFSELDTATKQHFMIDAALIAFGAALIATANRLRLNFLLRSGGMLAIALVLFIHTQSSEHAHVAWLNPYHRALSALLVIGAICYILRVTKPNLKAHYLIPVLLSMIGGMLVAYHDPLNGQQLNHASEESGVSSANHRH